MSRVRGLLVENEWRCDCSPRLPAIYLQVKKDNHNKGRFFYTCQKPQTERCGFFLWDTDAEHREKEQYGETLTERKKTLEMIAKDLANVPKEDQPAVAAAERETAPPPAKKGIYQPIPQIYPRLPAVEDDGFEYFDTPTKAKPARGRKDYYEDEYVWEDSPTEDEFDIMEPEPEYTTGAKRHVHPMQDADLSPPASPPARKKVLADPFTTPPKQITHTPHTPPDTKAAKSPTTNLTPLSYALINRLSPHARTLGAEMWANLKDHLLKCGRVADGALKGRESARAAVKEKEIRIDELERRVRILESEREVDRAVIGALKRNVDVLTGKVKRTD